MTLHTTHRRIALISALMGLSLVACTEDGTALNPQIPIPSDDTVITPCANEGIGTSTCTLENSVNPYRDQRISDDTKWDLNDNAPTLAAKFYLWATAMAKNPTGENQFYVADSLHSLYSKLSQGVNAGSNGVEQLADHTKLAYRTGLDKYFEGESYVDEPKGLDLVPDTDFVYSDWGSGSVFDGGVNTDDKYQPVFSVTAGTGWGISRAAVAYADISVGFASDATHLVFKYKDFADTAATSLFVKLSAGANAVEAENEFVLTENATAISDNPGWWQVRIPLDQYADKNLYKEFAIISPENYVGTFWITDVGLSGDANDDGTVEGDKDGNDVVYLYRSGTEQVAKKVRHWIGGKITDPGNDFAQLFGTKEKAVEALNSWGYINADGVLRKK